MTESIGLGPTFTTTVTDNPEGATGLTLSNLEQAMPTWIDNAYARTISDYLTISGAQQAPHFVNWDLAEVVIHKEKHVRVPGIRRNPTDLQLVKVLSRNARKLSKLVAAQLVTNVATLNQAIDMEKLKETKFKQVKNRLAYYMASSLRKTLSNAEIEAEFQKMLDTTRALPKVESITYDSKGRLIVTTRMLYVKRSEWKRSRQIGQYQIRIDFNMRYCQSGVRILNITKRFGHYDSPTTSQTEMCTGNYTEDLMRSFYTQNLPEIVGDTIDYLTSPHVNAGYLGRDGDPNGGWDQFLAKAKRVRKGYNFAQWDKENIDRLGTEEVLDDRIDSLEDIQILLDEEKASLKRDLDWVRTQRDRARKKLSYYTIQPEGNYQHTLSYIFQLSGINEERVRELIAYMLRSELRKSLVKAMMLKRVSENGVAILMRREGAAGFIDELFVPLSDFGGMVSRYSRYPVGSDMYVVEEIAPLHLRWRYMPHQVDMAVLHPTLRDATYEWHSVPVPNVEYGNYIRWGGTSTATMITQPMQNTTAQTMAEQHMAGQTMAEQYMARMEGSIQRIHEVTRQMQSASEVTISPGVAEEYPELIFPVAQTQEGGTT